MQTKVTKRAAGDWKVVSKCENATVVANVFRCESGGWKWAVETVNDSESGCWGLADWTETKREGVQRVEAFARECRWVQDFGWCC